MLISAVSVLVVAQSSSEFPEGLMNNPVYLSITDIAYRILGQRVVSVPMKPSADSNITTVSFVRNNSEQIVTLKVKCNIIC